MWLKKKKKAEENDEVCCSTYICTALGSRAVKGVTAVKGMLLLHDLYKLPQVG